MIMTEDEIVNSYKNAISKGKQLRILAELNECATNHIKDILIKNNIEIVTPGRKKKAEEEKKEDEELKKENEVVKDENNTVQHEVPEAVLDLCKEKIAEIESQITELQNKKEELHIFILRANGFSVETKK